MGKIVSGVIAGVFVLGLAGLVRAEEWPKWRGPRGDGIVRGETLPEKWPDSGPKKLWTAKVGMGYSSPIGWQGRVYMFWMEEGPKETLAAYDAGSGKQIWAQTSAGGYNNQGTWRPYRGTRTTPTIEGDRIYTYGGSGDLICRELDGGKEVWHLDVVQETKAQVLEFGISSSPLIIGDVIYVQGGSGAGVPVAVAVDKKKGQIVWQSEAKGVAKEGRQIAAGGGYATITPADVEGKQQIVVFAGTAVYGMDPASGKTIWSEPYATGFDMNCSTPVYHDGHVFVTSETGGLMLQVSGSSAKKDWNDRQLNVRFQPPILDRGDLYLVTKVGKLWCLQWPKKGAKWSKTDRELDLGGGASMVRIGDDMLFMGEKGKLSLVRVTAEDSDYKVLATYDVFPEGQNIWSTPLVYKGKIYCKGGDALVCLDPSGK